ncbi:hypothetical protein, partial [Streptomyces sp. b94]|uniref:hypothetical protein n=1 Tax=Streptomyces sp. b94 TaxID=1827634 RepID=UPI001C54E034
DIGPFLRHLRILRALTPAFRLPGGRMRIDAMSTGPLSPVFRCFGAMVLSPVIICTALGAAL